MSADFKEFLERAGDYSFDQRKLDAIPITGLLRKSPDPRYCILVISASAAGDLFVEIEVADVVGYQVQSNVGETAEDRVTLHIAPTAIVSTAFKGKVTNAVIPGFIATSLFGQGIREPVPSTPWREIVTPFSRLDVMLNLLDGVAWTDCRAKGKAECEMQYPQAGPDRDQCITNKYIACGPKPTLRVDERVLEQLVELFRPS